MHAFEPLDAQGGERGGCLGRSRNKCLLSCLLNVQNQMPVQSRYYCLNVMLASLLHPPQDFVPTHVGHVVTGHACCRGGGLLTRLIYARFQELVQSGHMHALPTLLPGQWHAGLKAVKSILRRIFIKRDRAWKAYTKVSNWVVIVLTYHSRAVLATHDSWCNNYNDFIATASML